MRFGRGLCGCSGFYGAGGGLVPERVRNLGESLQGAWPGCVSTRSRQKRRRGQNTAAGKFSASWVVSCCSSSTFSEQPVPRDPPTPGEYSGDAQPIQWRTQEQGDVHGGSPAKDGYPAVAEDYEGADHTKNDKQELQKEHLLIILFTDWPAKPPAQSSRSRSAPAT